AIEIFFLVMVSILLVFGLLISKKNLAINYIDLFWIIFVLYLLINIVQKSFINGLVITDIAAYLTGILFLVFIKVDITSYTKSLALIKWFSIFYALGTLLQFLSFDIYSSLILPLFSLLEQ